MRPLLLLLALAGCASAPEAPSALVDQLAPPVQTLDLSVSGIFPGQSASWSISGLTAGETVYLLWSNALASPGPCPAVAGGLCLDIAGPPHVLRRLNAGPSGTATFSTTIPLAFAPGGVTTFQAVALRGVGAVNSTKSRAVSRTTNTLPADQLQPGELVITEILKDPAAVADAAGEWVEVTNLSGVDVDLFGLTLSDDGGERFTVPTSRVLAAADRAIFAANGSPGQNGGVAVDVVWSGFTLSNADDEVILDAGNGVIDRVAYDDGISFPDPVGASLSLSDPRSDAASNDLGAAWCAGPAGPGDDGTPGAANPVCPAVCGDALLDGGEACDDGNLLTGDGCDAGCQIEPCGDGFVDPGEACDDGNLVSGDGCDAACQIEPACGDGLLDPGEACDDGNLVSGDGCDAACQIEPACGDGLLDPGEACDDGDVLPGDGCDAACQIEPACGDGLLDPGEACDDGDVLPGDGCDAACQIEPCGNGALDGGETCDDGNLVAGDGCDAVCQLEVCPNPVSRGEVTIDGRNSGYGVPQYVQTIRLPDGDLLWLGEITVSGGPLGNRTAAYAVRIDGTTRQPEWARRLVHPWASYHAVGAAPAPNGDVWVVANGSWGARPDDVFFARLSAAGALVSHTRINGDVYDRDFATHVAPTADGGFAFAGYWYDSFIDQNDVMASLAGISPTGAVLWQKNGAGRVDETEYPRGMLRMRNGNLAVWTLIDRGVFTDRTMVELLDPTGTRLFGADLGWEVPPEAGTELWNGDLLLAGVPSSHSSGRLIAINPLNWTVRWNHPVSDPAFTFYDPSPSITPPLCDPAPVSGQACALPDARCANTAGRVCDCTGGTWVCGTDRATLDVGWSLAGPGGGAGWTHHDTSGMLVRTTLVSLFGHAEGPTWRRPDGGYGEVVVNPGPSSGRISVLDTDAHRDAGCGQTEPTTLTSGTSNSTWTTNSLYGPGSRYTTSAETDLTVDALPSPTVTLGCHDEVCP